MTEIKQEVRQFYDQVGWQQVAEDVYQNARYEDLRPVSREYIHRCHLRILKHIKLEGTYLLDAGSGPVQYPEYLEYSRGYQYHVCADISITALKEARKRVGDAGMYVVADITNLPFKPEAFQGIISLHTIHHVPEEEHQKAYEELYRNLSPGCTMLVVNSWPTSSLMHSFELFVRGAQSLRHQIFRLTGKQSKILNNTNGKRNSHQGDAYPQQAEKPKGTFTSRRDVTWLKKEIGSLMPVEVFVWRSVSVRFLRALIHPRLGGRIWLRLLYWLEERYPHYFGEKGKYPLIVIHKD